MASARSVRLKPRRACVRTAKSRPQRLKPLRLCCVYVVAKAMTHKDSEVLTQTLRGLPSCFHADPPLTHRATVWRPSGTLEDAPSLCLSCSGIHFGGFPSGRSAGNPRAIHGLTRSSFLFFSAQFQFPNALPGVYNAACLKIQD